jgi:co-chaperonin GroES (HSP10)
MKAIGKYIVIDKINEEVKTESGLLLSASDVKDFRYEKGIVVTAGTEVSSIVEGDEIYYDKGHSYTMMIDNVKRTIIRENDVVVVSSPS